MSSKQGDYTTQSSRRVYNKDKRERALRVLEILLRNADAEDFVGTIGIRISRHRGKFGPIRSIVERDEDALSRRLEQQSNRKRSR